MPEKIIFYGFPLRLNFPKMFFFYDKCNISGKETKADAQKTDAVPIHKNEKSEQNVNIRNLNFLRKYDS